MYETLRCTIIDLADLDQAKVDVCTETSLDTCIVRNTAGDKCVLSWEGDTPQFIWDLSLDIYTVQEFAAYRADPENDWPIPEEDNV